MFSRLCFIWSLVTALSIREAPQESKIIFHSHSKLLFRVTVRINLSLSFYIVFPEVVSSSELRLIWTAAMLGETAAVA